MIKFYRLLFYSIIASLSATTKVSAQTIVFQETFDNPPPSSCEQGNLADGFITPNGVWTVNWLGVNDSAANEWYISATEPGLAVSTCATPGCHVNPTFTNRTLHVGNVPNSPNAINGSICPTGDCGAEYDPGNGFQTAVQTDKRVESPFFSLPGSVTNQLVFNYIFFADYPGSMDNVLVDFYDGTTWTPSVISPPHTINACGTGSYEWEQLTVNLPNIASTTNVKIGFRWSNDNGGTGTSRPSFAVDSITVYSYPAPPVATITASDTNICVNDCVDFFADPAGATATYDWSFQGASTATSSLQNPLTICYPNPGTYNVQLIVTNGGGSDTANATIVVNPCVAPTSNFVASDSVFCERSCITFIETSTNGATGWNWSFPGGTPAFSSSPSPPPVCYNTPGVYDVTLIVFNQFGVDTLTKTAYLTVNTCPFPIADFNSTVTSLCPQQCVSFTDNSQFGPITSYQWSFPGGNPDSSSSANPVVCYNEEGLYDVQLIVTNQYGSDTIVKYSEVNVSFNPSAFVCPDTAMYFGSSYNMFAGGGITYFWTPYLGLDTNASPTPVASPLVTTIYTVTITDAGGCIVKRQVKVTILHDNDVYLPNTFSPNQDGQNDYFFVRGNNLYGIRLTVFDRWGEKVFETTNQYTGWDGTYNGKELDPGVFTYVVTVNYSDKKAVTQSGTVTLVR